MQVEGGRIRRQVDNRRAERAILGLGLLLALAWLPYMVTWWMSHGWPAYTEQLFVGLIVIPGAIFGAAWVLAAGVTALKRWWHTPRERP
ncbi:MAG TPA: hypothetical protein VIS07_22070 [Candidatus Binatia bacterium]